MKGDNVATVPGNRGVTIRKVVFDSGPWHPLQVLSEA
jgi:hypothetical protein